MNTDMQTAVNAAARRDWTDANLETAMCLWEAALELRDRLPALSQEWEEHGTVAMRHRIIALVQACEKAWEDARAAGTEQMPYDWEHCPAFLIEQFGPLEPEIPNQPVRLVVDMTAGVLQGAAATGPVDYLVIDYNAEGYGDDDQSSRMFDLPDDSGGTSPAEVLSGTVHHDSEWVERVFAIAKGK